MDAGYRIFQTYGKSQRKILENLASFNQNKSVKAHEIEAKKINGHPVYCFERRQKLINSDTKFCREAKTIIVVNVK